MALLAQSPTSEMEDWQAGKLTIRDRNKHMFNNSLMSDVKFVVGKDLQIAVPAHKYVLAIGSSVFYGMFYGDMAEQRDTISRCTIELPDCEAESLLEFLRFIYCDELNLTTGCVLGTLYLGKKYSVPYLVQTCVEFLEKNIRVDSVFQVLVQARQFGDLELQNRCWKLIDRETASVIQTEGFLNITEGALEAFLQRDTLNVREIDLFAAVELWAERRCKEKGVEPDGRSKRNFIGDAIYLIRFSTMSQQDFAMTVVPSEILKKRDSLDVFKKFSKVHTTIRFSDDPRRSVVEVLRCSRFESTGNGWGYSGSSVDGIAFSADTSVSICGIRLFGNANHSYNVTVELRDSVDKVLKTVPQGTYSSAPGGKYGHVGFDVPFDTPVRISPNMQYYIRIKITGSASSFYGQNGVAEIPCSGGVKFTFSSYTGSNNGTGVAQGQIPEILYSKSLGGN